MWAQHFLCHLLYLGCSEIGASVFPDRANAESRGHGSILIHLSCRAPIPKHHFWELLVHCFHLTTSSLPKSPNSPPRLHPVPVFHRLQVTKHRLVIYMFASFTTPSPTVSSFSGPGPQCPLTPWPTTLGKFVK